MTAGRPIRQISQGIAPHLPVLHPEVDVPCNSSRLLQFRPKRATILPWVRFVEIVTACDIHRRWYCGWLRGDWSDRPKSRSFSDFPAFPVFRFGIFAIFGCIGRFRAETWNRLLRCRKPENFRIGSPKTARKKKKEKILDSAGLEPATSRVTNGGFPHRATGRDLCGQYFILI